jgi:hypothetical protein
MSPQSESMAVGTRSSTSMCYGSLGPFLLELGQVAVTYSGTL